MSCTPSPLFPRIVKAGDAIRSAVARGVAEGIFAYVEKDGETYQPFIWKEEISPGKIEMADHVFIIRRETAESYASKRKDGVISSGQACNNNSTISSTLVGDENSDSRASRQPTDSLHSPQAGSSQPTQSANVAHISWTGEVPWGKWANFYSKVLSRYAQNSDIKIKVEFSISNKDGISEQKIAETCSALTELDLNS